MKFLFSLSFFLFSFLASASTDIVKSSDVDFTQTEISISSDRGKKAKKNKRINKKRKRKCQQFGRRSFAG